MMVAKPGRYDNETLWQLLAPDPSRILYVPELGAGWMAAIGDMMAAAPGRSITVVTRRRLRAKLDSLVGRGSQNDTRRSSPSIVSKQLQALGTIEEIYEVWPSAQSPAVGIRAASDGPRRWIYGSSVLGLGGRSIWVRALLRSRPAQPLIRALAPSVAFVFVPFE